MILMYHKIYPESPTMWWVDVDSFYRQMCELKCRKVVYLDDYDPADRDQVVITFDGVYKNVLTFAAPILQRFGYPFELFVAGDYVGRDNTFDTSEPLSDFASAKELKELIGFGGRLQWHSRTHQNLKDETDEAVIAAELEVSEDLRCLDDKGFGWFAYPHGDFNPVLVEQTRKHFRGGISCVQGSDTDFFALNRITVTNETTFKKGSITVIIPSYNYGSYLIEAIESVLRQTRPVDEIFIADDCSTDDTQEIGLEYQRRHPEFIKFFRNEQNLGIVRNFNKAVSMASGDYICFLGADNRFRSDYIEKTAELLDSDDRIAIAYTDFALFGPRAKIMYRERFKNDMKGPVREDYYYVVNFPEFNEEAKQRITKENIFHGSSMFREVAFQDAGGYKDEKNMPEDWNLFTRMVKKGWSAKRVPHPVLEYRQHSREQSQLKVISGAELSYYRSQCKLIRHELAEKSQAFRQREQQLTEREQQLTEREQQLTEKEQQLTEREQELAENRYRLAEVNRQLSELAERDRQLAAMQRQLADRDRLLADKVWQLDGEEKRVTALMNSLSWRITSPFRHVYDIVRRQGK